MNPTQADEAKALEVARRLIALEYGEAYTPSPPLLNQMTGFMRLVISEAAADLRTQLADAQLQLAAVERIATAFVDQTQNLDISRMLGLKADVTYNLDFLTKIRQDWFDYYKATRQPTQANNKGDE